MDRRLVGDHSQPRESRAGRSAASRERCRKRHRPATPTPKRALRCLLARRGPNYEPVDEPSVVYLIVALLFCAWLGVMGWREEPSACSVACFRHGSRPRFHIPCSRCENNHPLR